MSMARYTRRGASGRRPDRSQRRAHGLAGAWSFARMRLAKGGLWLQLAVLIAVIAILAAPRNSSLASGSDNTYRLSAQDKVRITVYEWRPSKDELFEWKGINGEYIVQPSGNVAIPLIGEVRAAGLSTGELAQSIGTMLRDRTGLVQAPDVSAEVVLFRPIYVTGQVEHPGEFAFRPNLIVLQAVALSGGVRRPLAGARIEREIIAGRSDLRQQSTEYNTLLARKARFEAELAQEEKLKFPATLTEKADDPATAVLMQRETALFEARRSAYLNQVRTLKELHAFLESEVGSIQGQLETHNRQMALVRKELDAVNILVSKGLAVEPRRLGLERNVAQLEGDRLRLESSMTRVRQEVSRTAISILELSTKREIEAATGLSETQAKIEDVLRRFSASRELLEESESVAPMMARDPRGGPAQPTYTIIRQGPGGIATEIFAAETTPVQPGDTIKVELPVDDRPVERALDKNQPGRQPS